MVRPVWCQFDLRIDRAQHRPPHGNDRHREIGRAKSRCRDPLLEIAKHARSETSLESPRREAASNLDPMHAADGETAESLAARVHDAMSAKLTKLTAGRVPFLGMRWDEVF